MTGIVALCVLIGAPFRQISRAREVSNILGREQEPFWLTSGTIALSNLGITPPAEAKGWWKNRVVRLRLCQAHRGAIFARRIHARTCLGDPVPAAGQWIFRQPRVPDFQGPLEPHPRYRQMVNAFQGLAGLENDLTFLTDLKAETEQALARNCAKPKSALRNYDVKPKSGPRRYARKPSGSPQKPPRRVLTHGKGCEVQSEPTKAQIERLTWNDLIIEDTLREKLQTYCEILRAAEAFRERGVTIPKGLLFYGAPGTWQNYNGQAYWQPRAASPSSGARPRTSNKAGSGTAAKRLKRSLPRGRNRRIAPPGAFLPPPQPKTRPGALLCVPRPIPCAGPE